MNSKKIGVYALLTLMLILPMVSIVSAAPSTLSTTLSDTVQSWINNITAVANPIFKWIIGDSSNGVDFTMKILAFFLVMILIYGVLSSVDIFGDKAWINYVVGFIVAIVGVRFLPENLLQAFAVPSSALVAIIFLGLPFIVFFFLAQKINNDAARRVAWVLYAVLIFVLWFYNMGNDKLIGWSWIYLLFAAACIVAFLFDGKIYGFIRRGRIARAAYAGISATTKANIDSQQIEIEALEKDLANLIKSPTANPRNIDAKRKDLEKARKALKQLLKLYNP